MSFMKIEHKRAEWNLWKSICSGWIKRAKIFSGIVWAPLIFHLTEAPSTTSPSHFSFSLSLATSLKIFNMYVSPSLSYSMNVKNFSVCSMRGEWIEKLNKKAITFEQNVFNVIKHNNNMFSAEHMWGYYAEWKKKNEGIEEAGGMKMWQQYWKHTTRRENNDIRCSKVYYIVNCFAVWQKYFTTNSIVILRERVSKATETLK